VDTRYALLRMNGIPIGRTAFQVLTVRPEHLSSSSLPSWQYTSWKLFTRSAHPKLLVGGHLFRHDVSTVHFTEDLPSFDAFEWYRAAIHTATRQCGVHAVLLKDPPAPLVPHFLHGAPDYLLLRNDSSMQMSIPQEWHTITDYEKSLKHKYAQRFRKVRQSWATLQVAELSTDEVQASAATIHALYMQVTENQPVRMGILSEAFIPALKRFYGDKLRVWGIYENGRMIAFASAWVQSDSFDMFYIGFDYERNAALQLYFNILFFAIEQSIQLRKEKLILGRTALEAKARVGCRPEYLNTFLHIRNPILRSIIARLQSRLGETGSEWEQRHPFKEQKGTV
jgi:hypothetical protein